MYDPHLSQNFKCCRRRLHMIIGDPVTCVAGREKEIVRSAQGQVGIVCLNGNSTEDHGDPALAALRIAEELKTRVE